MNYCLSVSLAILPHQFNLPDQYPLLPSPVGQRVHAQWNIGPHYTLHQSNSTSGMEQLLEVL